MQAQTKAKAESQEMTDRQRILHNIYKRMNLQFVSTAELARIHDELLKAGALMPS